MDIYQASNQIIADILTEHTGQKLNESRRWRIGTALAGLFREYGIDNVDQLVCLIDTQKAGAARQKLTKQIVEALLNNETYFFRDKATFDQLPAFVLPELGRKRAETRRISIWCAGCSTGQEVQSIAMAFADNPERWHGWTIDILGTDISSRAIMTARSGLYSQFEVQRGLSVIEMLRHFNESAQGWQIKDETRKVTRFQQHNVLNAPPARQHFDLILCRNVLLYFDQATREQAFDRLASGLARDGFLMLGAGETVVGQTDAFTPLPKHQSLYQLQQFTASQIQQDHALAKQCNFAPKC